MIASPFLPRHFLILLCFQDNQAIWQIHVLALSANNGMLKCLGFSFSFSEAFWRQNSTCTRRCKCQARQWHLQWQIYTYEQLKPCSSQLLRLHYTKTDFWQNPAHLSKMISALLNTVMLLFRKKLEGTYFVRHKINFVIGICWMLANLNPIFVLDKEDGLYFCGITMELLIYFKIGYLIGTLIA